MHEANDLKAIGDRQVRQKLWALHEELLGAGIPKTAEQAEKAAQTLEAKLETGLAYGKMLADQNRLIALRKHKEAGILKRNLKKLFDDHFA